jgi:hypothetical protein
LNGTPYTGPFPYNPTGDITISQSGGEITIDTTFGKSSYKGLVVLGIVVL